MVKKDQVCYICSLLEAWINVMTLFSASSVPITMFYSLFLFLINIHFFNANFKVPVFDP